jgi:lipopolysaccharide export system permease protein
MYTTSDKRYFVMNLFRGTQYQEPGIQGSIPNQSQKYPFIRTNFKTFTKVWDMGEFEMVRTDEGRFSQNRTSLSMDELRYNLDSLQKVIYDGQQAVAEDWTMVAKRVMTQPPAPPQTKPSTPKPEVKPTKRPIIKGLTPQQRNTNNSNIGVIAQNLNAGSTTAFPKQKMDKSPDQYASFIETFEQKDRAGIQKVARDRSATSKNQLESKRGHVEGKRKESVKTGYELFVKYSFALICFIFLFIGAPMGAIIRKGGFGYPILVAIIFFIAFIMLTILCRKLAESYVLPTFWAAMTPAIIMIPIGAYLTSKAINDSPLFNTSRWEKLKHWYKQQKLKRKEAQPT